MRSGSLRHYITIQSKSTTKSSTGASTVTWSTFKQVYASISEIKGYEKESANAAWPGSDYRIKFRYVSGVLPTMRISYNGVLYSILDIDNVDGRNRELILICQSGVKAS